MFEEFLTNNLGIEVFVWSHILSTCLMNESLHWTSGSKEPFKFGQSELMSDLTDVRESFKYKIIIKKTI